MKSLFAWVYISFCVAWKNRRNTPIQNALVYTLFFGARLFLFIYFPFLRSWGFFCNNPKSNGKTCWLFVKGTEGEAYFRVGQHTSSLSTTLYCKNTCSSWMIMHEFILYSAIAYKSFSRPNKKDIPFWPMFWK